MLFVIVVSRKEEGKGGGHVIDLVLGELGGPVGRKKFMLCYVMLC